MSLVKEIDYGTPAETSAEIVTLEIDGQPVSVPAGTSVMRAAMQLGTKIPKLCATDSLAALGSCRLCLVEIEGRTGTPASCTTLVAAGMKVKTQTQGLAKLRRNVMELYISDHPLDCLVCSANGDCELQDMAGVTGLRTVRYGLDGAQHVTARHPEGDLNPLYIPKDQTNPYFQYDPSKCIVCMRCVRACEDIQGSFALTVEGRGFSARISAGPSHNFLESDCVSCGACVQACPTASLMETAVVDQGLPEHSVITTCAYCGVGCSFKAEMKGDQLIRMVPYKQGGANHGHSCVKGRFAWGYTTHKDRVLTPLLRDKISDPWREASWAEAIAFTAQKFRALQQQYGVGSIGGITSSRCTNEEVYVAQKMIRAAFGNNNVDTCARVCHSPTGYGLSKTFGTSAGSQDFKSVDASDVIFVIGANPTDGHPVFASRLKKRLRQGAKLVVIDPRRIALVRSPHIQATYHLQLHPGTNVAILNALSYIILSEGLENKAFIAERCDGEAFSQWAQFICHPSHAPEVVGPLSGVSPDDLRYAARLYAQGGRAAIYYGLGVTEHSQGSTMVMAMANLAMLTGNIGVNGAGINPLRGQNNVQGACDMGSFPHELPGYRHISDAIVRQQFEAAWRTKLLAEPGLRIPNMLNEALAGRFKGIFIHGEDIVQSDPNSQHVMAALSAMDCVVVQDLFLNETARFAHVFLPGTSFLEKDGTFTNAERRINRVRPVKAPLQGKAEWQILSELATGMGYPLHYASAAEIMDEIASLTPSFQGVSFSLLDRLGSVQWPCNENAPHGTTLMHVNGFARGKGRFMLTEYVPTLEKTNRFYPLILTTGRILSQYNVGAQTRRTANSIWHAEDVLEMHPHDAELRGIVTGQFVSISSRVGTTSLRALITDRMAQGVVYTTFHHPASGANIITTENSDWATNCPEYKVTAVQVTLANQPATLHESDGHERDLHKENLFREGSISAAE